MPKVPKSRRVKHVKSHKKALPKASESEVDTVYELSKNHGESSVPDDELSETHGESSVPDSSVSHSGITCSPANISSSLVSEHSYAKTEETVIEEAPPAVKDNVQKVSLDILLDARKHLLHSLPNYCTPIVTDETQLAVVFISRQAPLSLQRSVQFNVDGDVTVNVHCKPVPSEQFLKNALPPMPLQDLEGVGYFVDRAIAVVNSVRLLEVCAGADVEKYAPAWEVSSSFGSVDKNPFNECRYVETFRSDHCELLVQSNKWRCSKCAPLVRLLKRKTESLNQAGNRSAKTANVHLTQEEIMEKLKQQRKTIDSRNETIRRLRHRMQELIEKEGQKIERDLAEDLTNVLRDAKLTPAQSMFVQQQVKVSQLNNKSSMKWHPAIIRLALSIFETSRSAYERLRDSGFLSLPSSRTLYDYTHFSSVSVGVDDVVIESVSKQVDALPKCRRFHVLMADEMYISKNLVYKKATGELVGYTSLNNIDTDLKLLEHFFSNANESSEDKNEMATKVLCYLVKGVANNVKEVVAVFATKSFSPKQMYMWTWQVIASLERAGVYIIAFTGDGCPVNRAFVKMHIPSHPSRASGVVFATVNKCAPQRVLFFLSDIPHLLKTLRNSFYTSRLGKKGRRCMIKNKQKIVWDHIVRLYNAKKSKAVRKSYKLTAQHVHPDSYSCMKVDLAAQVLSNTVAVDLKSQKWSGTSETVTFISKVNNWFDCTNGAHTSVGKKTRNERLLPYTEMDDIRFVEMEEFLDYLAEWKEDARSAPFEVSGVASFSQMEDDGVEVNAIEEDDEYNENDTPTAKRLPAAQTPLGIEMSTLALIEAIKFLLDKKDGAGLDFINARVFCQDPLEQYFSKMRAGFGGSTNPNVDAFLHKARTSHVVGQIGIKRRGNSREVSVDDIALSDEPLQKRKSVRKGMFHSNVNKKL